MQGNKYAKYQCSCQSQSLFAVNKITHFSMSIQWVWSLLTNLVTKFSTNLQISNFYFSCASMHCNQVIPVIGLMEARRHHEICPHTTTTTTNTSVTFNGLFSRTTWVRRHQKGKPFWILLEQEVTRWQLYQLNHMQIICTSLQTEPRQYLTTQFLQVGCPSCRATNRVKALKAFDMCNVMTTHLTIWQATVINDHICYNLCCSKQTNNIAEF